MARITPSSRTIGFAELEDHEPYKGILAKTDFSASGYNNGELQLVVDWSLEGADEEDTVRDWIGLRLGKQKAGGVSKLRQLLNALSEKPTDAEIAWFDTETLEWGYDDKAYNKLVEGMPIIFRGVNDKKADGTPKFTIQVYQPVKAKVARKAAPADVDPNEIPF